MNKTLMKYTVCVVAFLLYAVGVLSANPIIHALTGCIEGFCVGTGIGVLAKMVSEKYGT